MFAYHQQTQSKTDMPRNILNDLSYAPPTSEFVGGVDFSAPLENLGNKYAEIDNYAPGTLDTLSRDANVGQAYKDYLSGQISKASSANPFDATRIYKQTIRNEAAFKADRNHAFGATQLNKQLYAAGAEQNSKVKTDADIKALKERKTMRKYDRQGGIGEYDELTGASKNEKGFNSLNFEIANEAVDVTDLTSKLGAGFESEDRATGGIGFTGDRSAISKNLVATKQVKGIEVANYVRDGLMSNTGWVAAERDRQEADLYKRIGASTDSKGKRIYTDEQALDMLEGNPMVESMVQNSAIRLANAEAVKRGYLKQTKEVGLTQTRKGELGDEAAFAENQLLVPQQTAYGQAYNNPNAAKELSMPETFEKIDFSDQLKKSGYTVEAAVYSPGEQGSKNAKYYKDGRPITHGEYTKAIDQTKKNMAMINSGKGQIEDIHKILRPLAKENAMFQQSYSDYYRANLGKKTTPKQYYEGMMKLYNSKVAQTATLADTEKVLDGKDIQAYNDALVKGKQITSRKFYNKNTGQFENFETMLNREFKIDRSTPKGEKEFQTLISDGSVTVKSGLLPINDEAMLSVEIRGRSFRVTGTEEQKAEFRPVTQLSRVMSQGLSTAGNGRPISNQSRLPESITSKVSNGTLRILADDGKNYEFSEEPVDITDNMGRQMPDGQRIYAYATGTDEYDNPANPKQVVGRRGDVIIANDIPGTNFRAGVRYSLDQVIKRAHGTSITLNPMNVPGKNTGNQFDNKVKKERNEN